MKLDKSQVEALVTKYMTDELIPVTAGMSTGNQVVYGIAMSLVKRKVPELVAKYSKQSVLEALGVFDEEGMLDIDLLYDAACENFIEGKKVSMYGFTFSKLDVDRLYALAKTV